MEIEARESNKSLEMMQKTLQSLLDAGVRRGDTLVVIGGGIVQDIGCFVASTLFRGLAWVFVPTTLLAQADSCIGSHSINLRGCNQFAFNPPVGSYMLGIPKTLSELRFNQASVKC